ncbi:olfactory receptor 49-like [Rana temporaria]|uniref:olfactory receptor 49-like n=1 Tax=Rana temporaria TaxID=8407 RepID=UPI001AAD7B81|nr:olfactory receptor 49-like [Rana temporaria]
MENVTRISTNFVLLGIVEMEKLKYLFIVIAIVLYLINMLTCSSIAYIILTEKTLHKPMYIFICNLVIDVMHGSSSFFPKLIIDLLSGGSSITLVGCLSQAFCIQIFSSVEVCTFAVMAYDRYLAVAEPLRYHNLMTNRKAVKFCIGIWVFDIANEVIYVTLTGRLTFCGRNIINVYCETMSLMFLACGDITVANLYGTVWALSLVIFSNGTAIFCYIGTFIVCLKISMKDSQKAIHTLITHVLTFSACMSSGLFVIFRYRLNGGSVSIAAQLAIAVLGLTVSLTLNPLVYGIRMEALRAKILQHLRKLLGTIQTNPTNSHVR